MALPFPHLLIALIILFCHSPFSSSSPPPHRHSLTKGSSLSVEKPKDDILVSPNGDFTAGFHSVGENAYCFAIWFSEPVTVVWMANRDLPVNGKRSKLSLLKSGKLILTDAGQSLVWSTETKSNSSNLQLQLNDNGNLALLDEEELVDGKILWQSFASPTDTLLPNQPLTGDTALVSSRSSTNSSSGFYKLYFDNDNVLRLVFNGQGITSVFWPEPWLNSWEAGRSTYNNSRTALLHSSGRFKSSDDFEFLSGDFGLGPWRRLTLDSDGNIRVYTLREHQRTRTMTWNVSWQEFSEPCKIHGICGENSLCNYDHKLGRKCSCLPGYKMKNNTDWSYGCEPIFKPSCNAADHDFVQLRQVEFYGFDIHYFENYTLDECKRACLQYCTCKGFQYKFASDKGYYLCYPKTMLVNGYQLGFNDPMYVRLPKSLQSSYSQKPVQEFSTDCPREKSTQLDRNYKRKHKNESLEFMLWFTCAFGAFEFISIAFFLYRTRKPSGTTDQGYLQVATGFKRFTYDELKKASRNFSEEIGRGGGGIVYKGKLSDNRVAAIKRLEGASNYHGEAEFLAEISTVGRLNHMNLIEIWGYCVERKHRLLVFEYIENGSLSENLYSNKLDWEKRFEIAVGTAKGLAYLHEECLEWVLHCDVKPQNILLDANYRPKVADFGLSKLLNRSENGNSSFSRIRGTRGYMAPEWVFNFPITSKVDVYSYGVVMLEMITGRSPSGVHMSEDGSGGGAGERRLVSWVREKINGGEGSGIKTWVEEIVDSTMNGGYDIRTTINLIKVSLQCAEEDRDARPTMSQVVHMLLHPEDV